MEALQAPGPAVLPARRTRRLTLAARLLGCGLALIGAFWAFAPAAQAGSGDPLVMKDLGVPGPIPATSKREFIRFAFTSKQSCNQRCQRHGGVEGFARIVMPPPQTETTPPFSTLFLGQGDGIEVPQIEDSALSGYVTVDKGSCKKLSLESVEGQTNTPDSPGFIDVEYRCKRGKQFLVSYSPKIVHWDADDSGEDSWEYGLRHRDGPGENWRTLGSHPAIEVIPFSVSVPIPNYTAPPAPLVATEVKDVGGEPVVYLTLNGRDEDSIKVETTLEVGSTPSVPSGWFTVDENGDPVPLTPTSLGALDLLRSFDQPPLEVSDCSIADACKLDEPHFAEVKVKVPPGVFTDSFNRNAWAVIVGANSMQYGWEGARRDCLAAGGHFVETDGLTPNGEGPADWRCDFGGSLNLNKTGLRNIVDAWMGTGHGEAGGGRIICLDTSSGFRCDGQSFCAYAYMHAVVDYNQFGDDYIWCPRATAGARA